MKKIFYLLSESVSTINLEVLGIGSTDMFENQEEVEHLSNCIARQSSLKSLDLIHNGWHEASTTPILAALLSNEKCLANLESIELAV